MLYLKIKLFCLCFIKLRWIPQFEHLHQIMFKVTIWDWFLFLFEIYWTFVQWLEISILCVHVIQIYLTQIQLFCFVKMNNLLSSCVTVWPVLSSWVSGFSLCQCIKDNLHHFKWPYSYYHPFITTYMVRGGCENQDVLLKFSSVISSGYIMDVSGSGFLKNNLSFYLPLNI